PPSRRRSSARRRPSAACCCCAATSTKTTSATVTGPIARCRCGWPRTSRTARPRRRCRWPRRRRGGWPSWTSSAANSSRLCNTVERRGRRGPRGRRTAWRGLRCSARGAALAYYFLFALFPALLFLTALLGLLPIPNLMDRLMEYVTRALPPDAASVTQKTLREIVRGAHSGLLSLGVLGALWAASNGMASIITALN